MYSKEATEVNRAAASAAGVAPENSEKLIEVEVEEEGGRSKPIFPSKRTPATMRLMEFL
jgi:hypothetical protein